MYSEKAEKYKLKYLALKKLLGGALDTRCGICLTNYDNMNHKPVGLHGYDIDNESQEHFVCLLCYYKYPSNNKCAECRNIFIFNNSRLFDYNIETTPRISNMRPVPIITERLIDIIITDDPASAIRGHHTVPVIAAPLAAPAQRRAPRGNSLYRDISVIEDSIRYKPRELNEIRTRFPSEYPKILEDYADRLLDSSGLKMKLRELSTRYRHRDEFVEDEDYYEYPMSSASADAASRINREMERQSSYRERHQGW